MNRNNETLWPGPMMTSPLVAVRALDEMSFCKPNFLFAERFPGILLLRQPE